MGKIFRYLLLWVVIFTTQALGHDLRVLSYNIFALPNLSKLGLTLGSPMVKERTDAFCEQLKYQASLHGGYDIILVQEAWRKDVRKKLRTCDYPYIVDEDSDSRILDSGLLILSRYRILSQRRVKYRRNGSFALALKDGEYFAKKSVLIAEIDAPLGRVFVANTHLVANYGQKDRYRKQRMVQMRTLVKEALETAHLDPLIIGGDLNFQPGSPHWKEFRSRLKHFNQAPGADAQCTYCGSNTFNDNEFKKIDHLLGSDHFEVSSGKPAFTKVVKFVQKSMNLSDHYGWESTFRFR